MIAKDNNPLPADQSRIALQTTVGKLCRNFGALTMGRVLGDLGGFLFFAVVSRTFGQQGIGQYSFAMALGNIVAVFADFGLYELTVKDMSRLTEPLGHYYSKVFSLRLLLCFFTLIGVIALLLVSPLSKEGKLIVIIVALHLVMYTLIDGVMSLYIAREDMHIVSLLEVSFRLLSAFTGTAVVLAGGALALALLTLPLMTSIQLLTSCWIVNRKYGPLWPSLPTRQQAIRTVRAAVPFALSGALLQLSSRMGILSLTLILGAAATGAYAAAYRVVFTLLFIPSFLGLALFPLASRLYRTSQEELRVLYERTFSEIMLVAAPAAAGLWLIAPDLMSLVFGPNFYDSILLLRILAWLLPLMFFRSLLEFFLLSCDRQVERIRCQWRAAWIGVLGNILLIFAFGVIGAAVATLLAEACLVALLARRLTAVLGWPRPGYRFLISLIATSAFVLPLSCYASHSLLVNLLTAVGLYTGILLLFKEVRDNEGKFLLDQTKRFMMRTFFRAQIVSSGGVD